MRILFIISMLLLAGCWTEREASSYQARGTFDGKPVVMSVSGQAEKQSGVDVEAAVAAAVSAAEGRFGAALSAIKPPSVEQLVERLAKSQPPPDRTELWAGLGAAGAGIITAGMTMHGSRKRALARAEKAEAKASQGASRDHG